ncbi:Activator of Hsp90 ATPase homolog 1-like protein [Soonwooa buanensis]|uniref:Activator of Hsp90 ATPase homolog 1-like protein n=1 Tax=Soonwooa buanensis TaxID=619805 RepID=A0A1T5GBZ4_9FLAO|nr:SRPBCC domain-containing protein [Soonwooa buanensis]SKC05882.1 Activator of Hsp90 ATPase homolog 1-like protein [Soonwooa buanensis]
METIKIDITILAPASKVWELYTQSAHIAKWNVVDNRWKCGASNVDFREGGEFKNTMSLKDGSYSFDYAGTFESIVPGQKIIYRTKDGRTVVVDFETIDPTTTRISQDIEPDKLNSFESQRQEYYNILNNFHKYVENH